MHEMRLNDLPYILINNGSKIVELRLNDEKRQLLNIGDFITFTNRSNGDSMKCLIKDLKYYNNFSELYKDFNKIEMGYLESDVADPADMDKYYSKEEQEKYGVVGIVIEKVD